MQVNIGKGLKIDVDYSAFSADVMEHVTYIGLRNILMDCHAGFTIKSNPDNFKELSQAAAEKKLGSMYAGDVHAAGVRTRLDPVEREARRMCLMAGQAAVRAKGKKLSSITTEQWATYMDANWEKYEDKAEAFLDAAADEPEDIDLDELGL